MKRLCIFVCLLAGCWLAVAGNQSKSSPDKPVRLYAATYTDNEMTENIQHFDFYPTDPFGLGLSWDYDDPLWTYTVNWRDGSTGNAVEHMHDTGSCDYGNWNDDYIASTTAWPVGSWPDIPPGLVTKHDGDTDYAPSPVILEHCETKVPLADHTSSYLEPTSPPYLWTIKQTANRYAQAKMKLQTGGRGLPGLSAPENLFKIAGWATQIIGVKDPLPWSANGPFVQNRTVPPQNIQILGKALGSDGILYAKLMDNTTQDVTPVVSVDYYTFGLTAEKHVFKSYTLHPAFADPDRERTTVGVGEEVNVYFDPPLDMTFPETPSWLAFDGTVTPDTGSEVKFTAPSRADSAVTVRVFVRDVQLDKTFDVKEPSNPEIVDVTSLDDTYGLGHAGAGMNLEIYYGPLNVSFYRVSVMEVGEDASNIQGYFFQWTPQQLHHTTADNWIQLSEDNSQGDEAYSRKGGYPQTWSIGQYTWDIPKKWKVGDGPMNSMQGCSQTFTIDSAGTATVTKLGHTVTRGINEIEGTWK